MRVNYIHLGAQFDALGQTPHPALTTTVFVIFMIMVPILLLNMLIAMMGNTYAQVIQQSEKEFVKQVSKVAYGCNFQKRPVIFLCYMRTIIDIIASFYYASGHGASCAWCQWSVHRHGNDE